MSDLQKVLEQKFPGKDFLRIDDDHVLQKSGEAWVITGSAGSTSLQDCNQAQQQLIKQFLGERSNPFLVDDDRSGDHQDDGGRDNPFIPD